jgi:uncharacterized protein YggL (DUF469 family)
MPETAIPDYSGFIEEAAPLPEDKMSRINVLVQRQLMLERKHAEAEELLKKVRQELESISDQALPDLMDDLGISELKMAGGGTLKIDTTIRASLGRSKDEEKADQAISWLISHNHPHLIKHSLTIPLTAGQQDLGDKLLEELEALNERLGEENEAWSISVEDKTDVNPGTLSAFVRGELKEGRAVPEDLFNVHRQRKAKIKV